MEANDNQLWINDVAFKITTSNFRFIEDNGEGLSGWEFNIETTRNNDLDDENPLWGRKPRFYAEGSPIPLKNLDDLTGVEIELDEPGDEETGEVYFTLYVFEHGDLVNLRLKFVEKKENKYKLLVTATIEAGSVLSEECRLKIETWIEQNPPGSY